MNRDKRRMWAATNKQKERQGRQTPRRRLVFSLRSDQVDELRDWLSLACAAILMHSPWWLAAVGRPEIADSNIDHSFESGGRAKAGGFVCSESYFPATAAAGSSDSACSLTERVGMGWRRIIAAIESLSRKIRTTIPIRNATAIVKKVQM